MQGFDGWPGEGCPTLAAAMSGGCRVLMSSHLASPGALEHAWAANQRAPQQRSSLMCRPVTQHHQSKSAYLCKPKVPKLDIARVVNEHVLGLQVAVHCMGGREGTSFQKVMKEKSARQKTRSLTVPYIFVASRPLCHSREPTSLAALPIRKLFQTHLCYVRAGIQARAQWSPHRSGLAIRPAP